MRLRSLGIGLVSALLSTQAVAGPRRDLPPPARQAGDGPGLDLLTLNAWGLPWPIASRRGPRLERMARYLSESPFHVVGLQEVWSGALSALGSLDLLRPNRREDSGLALLSRLDLAEDARLRPFRVSRGFDAMKSKGVLTSAVDVPGAGRVWVLVTHLQAGGGHKNSAVRREQVVELLEVADDLTGPVVLMGDLNFYGRNDTDAGTEHLLASAGFVDAAEVQGVLDPTHPGAAQRFDRVYLRDGRRWSLTPRHAQVLSYGEAIPFLSDHLPVRVQVDLKPIASPAEPAARPARVGDGAAVVR